MIENYEYRIEIIRGIGLKTIFGLIISLIGTFISTVRQWQLLTWDTVIGNTVLIASVFFITGGILEMGHISSKNNENEELGSLVRLPVQLLLAGAVILVIASLVSLLITTI